MIGRATLVARMYVARFRLRFLLQELELTGPTVTVGRSSECQVTLDDPLVSRVHARITVTDDAATVRDLGSRNGVRVNDQLIDGETLLAHNDRIRLGTQDLVFVVADSASSMARIPRSTGAMAHCAHCGRAFPAGAEACPRCGELTMPPPHGPDTVTDVSLDALPSWTFRLMSEVIERALLSGRFEEAERMLARAVRDLESSPVDRRVAKVVWEETARHALRLAQLSRDHEWAEWAARTYRREQLLPDESVIELLEALDLACLHVLKPELEALLIDRAALGVANQTEHEQSCERRLLALVSAHA